MEAVEYYSLGKMNATMQMVAICQDFGWTYEEYMGQPAFFLTLIREKMVRDQKEQELAAKKSRRGH